MLARARAAGARALSSSARLTPGAPTWDPRAALSAGGAPAAVTDADMTRLARLSALALARGSPDADAEIERVRAGVAAVLTAARALPAVAGGGGGGGACDDGGDEAFDAALAALSEADLDAVAEARWAELRADIVTEGAAADGDVPLGEHAAERDGPFFVAPTGDNGGGANGEAE
jgi:hypothetical protein